MRPRPNRRTFLKLSAAGCAALRLQPAPLPAIGAALPLPYPHQFVPNPEALLDHRLAILDLLLLPAYAAAALIQGLRLQPLGAGLPFRPGRPHDPDGAFALPALAAVTAVAGNAARPESLDDLWQADSLWPETPRLVIGAALLRRGYPLNDTHPGHLEQVERDLLERQPRLETDPLAGLRAGRASLALVQAPLADVRAGRTPDGLHLALPEEGAALLEYDWLVLAAARRPEALAFLAQQPPGGRLELTDQERSRLRPPALLPPAALARRHLIWQRLRQAAGLPSCHA